MSTEDGPLRETAAVPATEAESFRNYGAAIASISADWFARPIQELNVTLRGEYSRTADGACEVALDNGAIAFVKPRPGNPNPAMIAREKIAADLGFMLGAPVAPVLVRAPQADLGWPNHTALSLNCLPTGRLWSAGGSAHIARLAPFLEALRVYWTWIGDTDHNGHGQNIAWRVGSDAAVVSGFDHSYCLGHQGADPLKIPICQGYGTAPLSEAKHAREVMICRIENAAWSDITSIVERLGTILPDVDQKRMLKVLEVRRSELRRFLG